ILRTNGAFQQAASLVGTNEMVVRGYLLLGEAQLQQKDYEGVNATLPVLLTQRINPELSWRAAYLQCRLLLAQNRLPDALLSATNLAAIAQTTGAPDFQAETVVMHAGILEKLDRPDEAIGVYQRNLGASAPLEQQRYALLKITELYLQEHKIAEAAQVLEQYL